MSSIKSKELKGFALLKIPFKFVNPAEKTFYSSAGHEYIANRIIIYRSRAWYFGGIPITTTVGEGSGKWRNGAPNFYFIVTV